MKKAISLALGFSAALMLGACSETKVQDLLGSGKAAAPDETQVRVNQNLSMPPDLQLKAPSGAVAEYGQPNVVASAPPPQPIDQASAAPEQLQTTGAVQPQTATTAQPVQPQQDIYERLGVSKTYPDGKPKPERVLVEELREAQIAEKRRKNPNYGTIWNMGNIFKDE